MPPAVWVHVCVHVHVHVCLQVVRDSYEYHGLNDLFFFCITALAVTLVSSSSSREPHTPHPSSP